MSGVVPTDFKRARVVPVYKSSTHVNFDNYRSISVLPAISKILEKCVHSQFIEHLEKNNLLSQNQFGFRKYRATELAAVWFTDQISRSMGAGMFTGAIYVDMSQAIDTVRHAGIINKLPDYGSWVCLKNGLSTIYLIDPNKSPFRTHSLDQSQLFVVFPRDQY